MRNIIVVNPIPMAIVIRMIVIKTFLDNIWVLSPKFDTKITIPKTRAIANK